MKNNFNISVHCVTLPNHSMLVGACARRYILVIEKIKKRCFFTRESYPSEPSLSYSIPRRNTIVDFSHLTIDILAYKIQKRDTVELPFWGSASSFFLRYNCSIVIFLMLACYTKNMQQAKMRIY
jgi:hypothetical protein